MKSAAHPQTGRNVQAVGGRDKRIRVLFVIGSSEVGGAESIVLSLMQGLPSDRFSPSIACPASGPMVERYAKPASEVLGLSRNFLNPWMVWKLVRFMKERRIDLVHTCLYTSDVAGVLAARIAGVPKVVCHLVGLNFDISDERGVHYLRKRLLSFSYRFIYVLADHLIAAAEAVKEDLIHRAGWRVPERKITVIHTAIMERDTLRGAPDEQAVREQYAIREDSTLIAVVANLAPYKGHRSFLQAVAEIVKTLPDLQCALIGDGPKREELEQLTRDLNLQSHILFTGTLTERTQDALVRLSRMVVLPSLSGEGLPLVLLEAMALGKPVVATDVGGTREIIKHGLSGLIVAPGKPKALVEAILRMLSDDVRALQMGRRGREQFETLFVFSKMIGKLKKFYSELLGTELMDENESIGKAQSRVKNKTKLEHAVSRRV